MGGSTIAEVGHYSVGMYGAMAVVSVADVDKMDLGRERASQVVGDNQQR